jgi:hypothetical protein
MPLPTYKDAQSRKAERERKVQERMPKPWWWFKQHDPVARFTLYVGIFTLCLVIVGVLQWCSIRGQLDEMGNASKLMHGQLDEMVAQQRPWISVNLDIVKPIRFSEWSGQKSIFIPLHFTLKNFGLSPATNIQTWTHVWPHPGNANVDRDRLNSWQEEACLSAEKSAIESKNVGVTVFPTEPKIVNSGASGPIFKIDNPDIISVEGCIDYTYAGNRHGKTGFRMIIGRVVNHLVFGLPYIKGMPVKNYQPSRDMIAKGFPAKAPTEALLYPGSYYFAPDDGGNYAK